MAVCGALARGAELALAEHGRADLHPVRIAVDMFAPVRMQPIRWTTDIVRDGSRLCLIDVALLQDDRRVARAAVTFVKPSEAAPGHTWNPTVAPTPPSPDLAPESERPRIPFFRSTSDWSQDIPTHQNADRKESWSTPIPVVVGEKPSGFQSAAAVADGASMLTNWGTAGVGYINSDVTLALTREPTGYQIGLSAIDRVESAGAMVGTVRMFDRQGTFGSVLITAISNAKRAIDFTSRGFPGTRRRDRPE